MSDNANDFHYISSDIHLFFFLIDANKLRSNGFFFIKKGEKLLILNNANIILYIFSENLLILLKTTKRKV